MDRDAPARPLHVRPGGPTRWASRRWSANGTATDQTHRLMPCLGRIYRPATQALINPAARPGFACSGTRPRTWLMVQTQSATFTELPHSWRVPTGRSIRWPMQAKPATHRPAATNGFADAARYAAGLPPAAVIWQENARGDGGKSAACPPRWCSSSPKVWHPLRVSNQASFPLWLAMRSHCLARARM
jgi:hypothetical protein